jgi:hypothetical protein
LIRHAGRVTLTVGTLPVAMIEPALQTLLVPAVSRAVLPEPGLDAASRAAIALPAVAARTNPEHRLASLAATNPRPEDHFSMNRHRSAPAGFDNGNGSCQGGNSLDGSLRMKVAKPEPRCVNSGVLHAFPKSPYSFSGGMFLMLRINGGSRRPMISRPATTIGENSENYVL